MKERLNQLLRKKKLSPAKFASKIGVSPASISHILSGRNKPSADFFANMAEEFPDVNLNWLLTGQGPWSNNPTEAKEPIDAAEDASLFDKEFSDMPTGGQPTAAASSPADNKPQEPQAAPLMAFSPSALSPGKSRKLKRIILFFDDGTFECYGE